MATQDVNSFKFWANKIIPLVYDDSLSYYEFLCKVMQKLNEVIGSVNDQNTTIKDMQDQIDEFIAAERQAREDWELTETANRAAWELQQAQKMAAFELLFVSDYDSTKSYTAGNVCRHEGLLYAANDSTTGSWNSAKWDQIVLADYLANYVQTAAADMQAQYDAFLENYQRTFGVVQTTGASTTDVMSQDAVTKLSLNTLRLTAYVSNDTLDLNDVTAQGRYWINSNWTLLNAPGTDLVSLPHILTVEQFIPNSILFVKQTIARVSVGYEQEIAYRYRTSGGSWTSWFAAITRLESTTGTSTTRGMTQAAITTLGMNTMSLRAYLSDNTLDFNDVTNQGLYIVDSNWSLLNAPHSSLVSLIQCLKVEKYSRTLAYFIKQTVCRMSTGHEQEIAYRYLNNSGWTDWQPLTGEFIENNYTNNLYENTYNVSASPTIAQQELYVLESTGDNTDRTNDIQTMLANNGICILGSGLFVTTGIVMPANSTLTGQGNNTILRLDASVSDGCAVQMNTDTIVEKMRIDGGASSPSIISTIGTRDGIRWIATADAETPTIKYRGKVNNCFIRNFTGCAIKGSNTGFAIHTGLEVVQCTGDQCCVGIGIMYFSEFWQVTASAFRGCYYGCINNGGNNMFTGCVFSANIINLLMDNSSNQSPNNSHGAFTACAFNHADSNNGYSIKIYNCDFGETFTGCTVFYGKILCDDSNGIIFTNINGGTSEGIEVNGGGLVMFNACTWVNSPTFNVSSNDNVKVINCFTKTGSAITI